MFEMEILSFTRPGMVTQGLPNILLKREPVHVQYEWALIRAAGEGHLEIVKYIAEDWKISADIEDGDAFIYAAQNGH